MESSKTEMKGESVLELGHERRRDLTDSSADSFDRHRADLLRLGLRIALQTASRRGKQHLKRMDPDDAGSNGNDGNDAAVEA